MNYYTHAGLFHCDEVTGYAICYLAGECEEVVRLTDLSNIPTDGIIADIGREYDPDQMKFDHHQELMTRDNHVPYATAGLLWRKYGEAVVADRMSRHTDFDQRIRLADIAERVDMVFIEGIDAHDADSYYEVTAKRQGGTVRVMTLPNIVSTYNYHDVKDDRWQNIRFVYAANLVMRLLEQKIADAYNFLLTKREFERVVRVDGTIAHLPLPLKWREIVDADSREINWVIAPSVHPGNPYSLTAVSKRLTSREVHIPIDRPDWFDGFIHLGRWIAGGNSVDELVRLAEYSERQFIDA